MKLSPEEKARRRAEADEQKVQAEAFATQERIMSVLSKTTRSLPSSPIGIRRLCDTVRRRFVRLVGHGEGIEDQTIIRAAEGKKILSSKRYLGSKGIAKEYTEE